MRSADASTILRIGVMLLAIYLVLIKINPIVPIVLLALAFILDGVDGFLALSEISKGKVSLSMYLNYSLGEKTNAKKIKSFKESISKTAKHGPRFDVAADRIMEYSLWAVFTVVGIVPLFVLIIIIIRHSIADAMLGAKGTSSKMKTGFAKAFYTSNVSRAAINILKFITFAYLMLVYISAYPILPAYILVGLLVAFIVVRGTAEVYDSLKN